MLDERLGYVSDGKRLEPIGAEGTSTLKLDDRVADPGLDLLMRQPGASHVCPIDSTAMLETLRFVAHVLGRDTA
jgi:hypothetical protein